MTSGAAGFASRAYLLFVILGGFHLVWFLWLVLRARASADWPTTEARVLTSQLEYVSRAGHAAFVYYRYSVGGREYVGKRLRFAPPFSQAFGSAQQDAREYPPGRTVDVAYNPSAPDDSVIETRVSPLLWFYVLGAIGAMMFGLAGLILG